MNHHSEGNDIEAPEEREDWEGLGAIQEGDWAFGFDDEVDEPESVECPDFHPSRHELEVLAKYWRDSQLRELTFCWLWDVYGYSYFCVAANAGSRICRIAEILGEDRVHELAREVEQEYRKKLGDDAWGAFRRGDTEWRDRELDRIHAEIDRERQTNKSPS
jgi:hypothetical protein